MPVSRLCGDAETAKFKFAVFRRTCSQSGSSVQNSPCRQEKRVISNEQPCSIVTGYHCRTSQTHPFKLPGSLVKVCPLTSLNSKSDILHDKYKHQQQQHMHGLASRRIRRPQDCLRGLQQLRTPTSISDEGTPHQHGSSQCVLEIGWSNGTLARYNLLGSLSLRSSQRE